MPINPKAKLVENIFEKDKIEWRPTRDGYGAGLVEAGKKDNRIVVLCADLTESTRSEGFAKKFPERFIEMGVAEQNMATIAAGMANYGKIPFISSYAAFSPGRNNEQIRTTICINNVPVKIGGAHAGISVGPDGATHQALEDIALMRVLPRMTVLVPCDAIEAQKATISAAFNGFPTYIRFGREKSPVFTTKNTPYKAGRAEVFFAPAAGEKPDVVIIGCGMLVYNALLAANDLEKEGLKVVVVNNHTVKPIDDKAIIQVAKEAGRVITVEEHQIAGGMGSAVAEILVKNCTVPMEFIGVHDRFGESGAPWDLVEKFGMGVADIKKAVKKVLKRK